MLDLLMRKRDERIKRLREELTPQATPPPQQKRRVSAEELMRIMSLRELTPDHPDWETVN